MESELARKRRVRGPNDGGAIDQRPSGRWRLRVRLEDGRQVAYGTYETEDEAITAQARWRLTHLLAVDDPELVVVKPASVAVGGVRCDEWFDRWQQAKGERRSRVRVGHKRGGAPSTQARDRAQWKVWWSPAIGERLPHTLVEADVSCGAEFRSLQLGTWLGTTDGEVIETAVGMVIPPIYRPEYDLAVDGLKLAARLQQQAGQEVAGKVAASLVGVSLVAAGVVALGRSAA